MATKRIPKAERIGAAIVEFGAHSRIYGQARQTAWEYEWRAEGGEHCAHVAALYRSDADQWGAIARASSVALVALTGAMI